MSPIIKPTPAQLAACSGFLLAAEQWIGQREVAGSADNPFILECLELVKRPAWARLGLLHDETAWCAAFAHRVLQECGLRGTGSASARSFLRWGVRLAEPVRGCVAVYSRPPNPLNGHVGFWLGRAGQMDVVLGGNQGNGVSRAPRAIARSLGYFAPSLQMLTPELTS